VVVDCTGSPRGLARAVALTRPLGTLVLKTTCAGDFPFNPAPLVIHEITLLGSRCGPFPPALDALAAGTVEVQSLVSAAFPLSQGVEAFRKAREPGVLKVLLRP